METKGIIMFNRGDKCIVRAIVCLYSLRKWWDGPVTFYLENPMPQEFVKVCRFFNVDVVHNEEKHELKTLVRKTDMFCNPPYDRTLWIDSDTIILGKLDEMFNYLDNYDVCIPHFAGWWSDGGGISKRIKRFEGVCEKKHLDEALKHHPAINTGILSFKKSEKWQNFVEYWVDKADVASKKGVFIADEVCFQVLYPSISDWGLTCFIAPTDFNVSVLHDHGQSKDMRVIHMHGQKHVLNVPLCEYWKTAFKDMCENNIANINDFLQYADKRLSQYLKSNGHELADTTIVTAIDEKYVEALKYTFPNWRKYKNIDKNPVIVFVYGMEMSDARLDFLRLPNVRLIPWNENCMDAVETHRELMLSAFVFGAAQYVTTDYWVKLDADSYATNSNALYDEDFKNFSIVSHKWGYSRPDHIMKLDEWAKTCWHKKIKVAKPMIEDGRVEGNRFYHKAKRIISYVCFQKTRFTRYCVKLLDKKRLPCPSQDTFAYYVIQKLKPEAMSLRNFKKNYGFTQGRGKLGAEHIKQCVDQIDVVNAGKISDKVIVSNDIEESYGE